MLQTLAVGGQQLIGAAHHHGDTGNFPLLNGAQIGQVARIPVDEAHRLQRFERQIAQR